MTRLKNLVCTATAIISTALLPSAASACEMMHGYVADVKAGNFKVFLNGALLINDDDGASNGNGTFLQWLVQGENEVRVEFQGSEGTISLIKACNGTIPGDDFFTRMKFDADGTKTMRFVHDKPVDEEYTRAAVTDGSGLMDAVKSLQNSARSGDMDAILALYAPMFREAERRSYNIAGLKAYMRKILTENPVSIAKSLTVTPILGGRVFQVVDASYESPISTGGKIKGGSFHWSGGTFWAKFDGKWQVIGN